MLNVFFFFFFFFSFFLFFSFFSFLRFVSCVKDTQRGNTAHPKCKLITTAYKATFRTEYIKYNAMVKEGLGDTTNQETAKNPKTTRSDSFPQPESPDDPPCPPE